MQATTPGVAGEFAFHALHGFVSRSVGVARVPLVLVLRNGSSRFAWVDQSWFVV